MGSRRNSEPGRRLDDERLFDTADCVREETDVTPGIAAQTVGQPVSAFSGKAGLVLPSHAVWKADGRVLPYRKRPIAADDGAVI
jgi:hypothetical protein